MPKLSPRAVVAQAWLRVVAVNSEIAFERNVWGGTPLRLQLPAVRLRAFGTAGAPRSGMGLSRVAGCGAPRFCSRLRLLSYDRL